MSDEVELVNNNYLARYANVKGSRMYYIEAGQGEPVLFIHGIPTSSYLWRNIIPGLSDKAHCIAVDLIGMGDSDKPDIDYTVFDHIAYIEGFIQQLKLKQITLVLHGWGSVIGFEYARRHSDNVKAIAFYESHLRPITSWSMLSLPVQQFASLLERPKASYRAIVEQNYLVNKMLPRGAIHRLSEEVMSHYRKPFLTPQSRKPLWQFIQDLPLGKPNGQVNKLIEGYSTWLQKANLPKLMFYAVPGFITTMETVQWAKKHLPDLTLVELEDALHFAQESSPERFANGLRRWFLTQAS